MPIYEYRCKDCGKVSEFQMKMSDPNPEICPTCGHSALAKIMSLPSFQLKGGGWYSDAYDGKSNKSGSPSPNSEASPAPAAAGEAPVSSTGAASPTPATAPSATSSAPASASSSSASSTPSGGSERRSTGAAPKS